MSYVTLFNVKKEFIMAIDLNAFLSGCESYKESEPVPSMEQLNQMQTELKFESQLIRSQMTVVSERAATFQNLYTYQQKHNGFGSLGEVIALENYTEGSNKITDSLYRSGMESIGESLKKMLTKIKLLWNKFTAWIKGVGERVLLTGVGAKIKAEAKFAKYPFTATVVEVADTDGEHSPSLGKLCAAIYTFAHGVGETSEEEFQKESNDVAELASSFRSTVSKGEKTFKDAKDVFDYFAKVKHAFEISLPASQHVAASCEKLMALPETTPDKRVTDFISKSSDAVYLLQDLFGGYMRSLTAIEEAMKAAKKSDKEDANTAKVGNSLPLMK